MSVGKPFWGENDLPQLIDFWTKDAGAKQKIIGLHFDRKKIYLWDFFLLKSWTC